MSVIEVKLTSSGDVELRPRKAYMFRDGIEDHTMVWVPSDKGQPFTFEEPDFTNPPIIHYRKRKHYISAVDKIPKDSSIEEYGYTIYVMASDGTIYPSKKPKKEDEGGRGVIRNED